MTLTTLPSVSERLAHALALALALALTLALTLALALDLTVTLTPTKACALAASLLRNGCLTQATELALEEPATLGAELQTRLLLANLEALTKPQPSPKSLNLAMPSP